MYVGVRNAIGGEKMAEITSGDINGKKPSVSTGVKKKPKKKK